MSDAMAILTSIAVLLLVGLLISMLSNKIKLPDILLLIFAGIAFGAVVYKDQPLISFPPIFLTALSIFALAIIVFDSSAKLRIREFDVFSLRALKLVLVFLVLNLILFTAVTHFMTGASILLSLIFAAIMSGTSPEIVLSLLKGTKNKAIETLKLESIINTPLTVLLPFIFLDFTKGMEITIVSKLIEQLTPFLTKFVAGIGAGILVGVILFKFMKDKYSDLYSPLAVLVASLLTYVLAENLGGNGVLGVTTLGLFFGNIHFVKQKVSLLQFESLLAKALYIFVFVSIGLILKIPLTFEFFSTTLMLFGAYLVIRYLAITVSFRKKDFSFKEKMFMTLNASKGIAVAVVVFTLTMFIVPGTDNYIPGLAGILDLTLIFILYSIILASITCWFSKFLVGEEITSEFSTLKKRKTAVKGKASTKKKKANKRKKRK